MYIIEVNNRNKAYLPIRLTIVFLLIFVINTGYSQKQYIPQFVDPLTEPWRWRNFPELDGKGVRCIAETRDGIIWFGTNHGVIRYNGITWEPMNTSTGFTDLVIHNLFVARNQDVYAATDSGLYCFSQKSWKRIFPDVINPNISKLYKINCIKELPDNSILVSTGLTFFSGLLHIKNGKIIFYSSDNTLNSLKKNKVNWQFLPVVDELRNDKGFYIEDFFVDNDHTIWGVAAPEKKHIKVFNVRFEQPGLKLSTIKVYGKDDGIRNAFRNSIKRINNEIWVVNGALNVGINIFDGKKWRYIEPDRKVCDEFIHTSITQSSDGVIWIGGMGMFYVIKNGKWTVYKNPQVSLPNARFELFEDSKGFLWVVGKQKEVFRVDYSSKIWTTYKGLNYQCQTRDERQYFLSVEGEIIVKHKSNWYSLENETNLPSDPVKLVSSKNGYLWVAGSHNNEAAIAYFNGKSWKMDVYPTLSWGIDYRSVFEDISGNIWFGSSVDINFDKGQKAGVIRYKPDGKGGYIITHYEGRNSTNMYNAYGIGQSLDGRIWVGGSHLASFDGTKWENYLIPVEQYQFQECIKNIEKGDLWVGSRYYGVFRFTGKNWENYDMQLGLLSNTIISILPLNNANVWVATDKDICRFDGRSWTTNIFPPLMTLTREGGELLSGYNGSLWINKAMREWKRRSRNQGKFNNDVRELFCAYNYNPDIKLPETSILSPPSTSSYNSNIVINWTGKDHYNNTPAERLQFSYRINGGNWSPFEQKSYVTLWGLPNGTYKFEVRARDLDFNIDDTPAQTNFIVLPPIWKQFWFIALIVSFILIITIYQIRAVNRNYRLGKLNQSLELAKQKLEEQKEQIIEQNKREHESMNARMRFFTNISHEFRTPLTLISGTISKIIHQKKSSEKEEIPFDDFKTIEQNSNRLLHLVNQLMDFRKLESGTMPLRASKGDIIKFLEEVYLNFRNFAQKQGVILQFEKSFHSLEVWFDSDKLEKILFNLISNAIKFSPEGGIIKLSFSTSEFYYLIKVEDTGIGIPSHEIDKIFDPFYQTQLSRSMTFDGTGIGLALVKSLVELHKGKLNVTSFTKETLPENSQFSTCFEVELPLGNDFLENDEMVLDEPLAENYKLQKHAGYIFPEEIDENLHIESQFSGENREKPLVLFVEDSNELRRFLYQSFQTQFAVLLAANGKEGLSKTIEFLPDMVVSDVMMPEMDGNELCKAIKADVRISHIPVILLTARSADEQYLEGYSSGADDYVIKPFNNVLLAARIMNLIGIRLALKKQFTRELSTKPFNEIETKVDSDFLKKVIALIEEKMTEPEFNVDTLSAEIGLSSRHLLNKLQSLTDYTPVELIRVLRLKRAVKLLNEQKLSISEIAYDVGFSSPAYFSRCFQKQYNQSPTDYLASLK